MKTLGLPFSLSNSGQQDHGMEIFKMFISSDGWVPKHFLLSTENLIEKRSLKRLTTRQKILVMQVSKFSDCGLEFACFGIKKDSLAFSAIGKFVEDHFQLLDSDKSDQRGHLFFLVSWKISTRPPTFSCGIVQTSLKF